jgi:uncharacterized repeat protein (TIGR01451 family)
MSKYRSLTGYVLPFVLFACSLLTTAEAKDSFLLVPQQLGVTSQTVTMDLYRILNSSLNVEQQGAATNGKIAFSSNRVLGTHKIFTMNADGTGITCLMCPGASDPSGTGTTDQSSGFSPAFSPDGATIAFTRSDVIWLMNADGTNQRSTGITGGQPQWSPDGSKLVFWRDVGSGGAFNAEIFIANVDGTGETRITNSPDTDDSPSWGAPVPGHPQGRIAFTSQRDGNSEIYVIFPLSLTEPFQTAPIANVSSHPARDASAKWSSDGTKLVFSSTRDNQDHAGEIYTLNPDTDAIARLTNDNLSDSFPAWSPDGTKIAFMRHTTSTQAGNYEIFTVNSVPADPLVPPVNVTNHLSNDFDPSWGTAGTTPSESIDLSMETMTDEPDPVGKGSNYRYLFSLRNSSTTAATGVKIVFDPIPTNIRVHPIMLNCNMAVDRKVTCTFGDLPARAISAASVTFVAEQEGTVNVRATLSANESDPDMTNNSKTQSTTIVIPADVALLDHISPDRVVLGENFTYRLKVGNYGPGAAKGIRLESTLSPELEYVSATEGCTRSGNKITCELGDINSTCPTPATCPASAIRNVAITARGIKLGNGAWAAKNDVLVSTLGSYDNLTFNNSRTIRTDILLGIDLIGLEVTQGIQDLANSVPLVQDKPAFVRAYIKSNGTGAPLVNGMLMGNRIESSGGRTPLGSIAASNKGGTIKALQNPSRSMLNDSFYFELPASWRSGMVEMEFRSSDAAVMCKEPDGTSDCKVAVTFQKMNKVSINFLLGTWTDAAGGRHVTNFSDVMQTMSEIGARFPTYEFDTEIGSITLSASPCSSTPSELVREVEQKRTQDISNGKAVKRFYMGLMSDQSTCGSTYGQNGAAYNPGNSSLVFTYDNSNTGRSSPTAPSPTMDGNSRAHELAHNFDISHTASGLNEAWPATDYRPVDGRVSTGRAEYGGNTAYGFDIFDLNSNRDGLRIFPATTYDFMSYGRPRWVSVFNYNKLFNSIGVSTSASNTLTADPEMQVAVTNTVVVSGTVSSDPGSGTIEPLFVKETNGTIELPAAGSYAIRFENAADQVLATHSFEPPTDADGVKGPFALVLPWNAEAKRVVLLHNGQEIASRQASTNAPAVTVTSPNGGETLNGSTSTFTWNSSDADGDSLTYVIDHSSDAGASWTTLATGLASTSYSADIRTLAGSSRSLLRVTASDGFNSRVDRSNAVFTVPPRAPQAAILSPQNDRIYIGEQQIVLQGSAFDIDQGPIAGDGLAWTSSSNGPLGMGNSLTVSAATLQEGDHTITLTATDSGGQIGTATMRIRVFRDRPVFPAALAVGSNALAFTSIYGQASIDPRQIAIRNSGDGALTWTATADQPWIVLNSVSGEAPFNLDVTPNSTGLIPGTYTGKVTITSNDGNAPQVIDVSYVVFQGPAVTALGRVLTPDNRGLRSATVAITDSAGKTRTTLTNSFGNFTFSDLPGDRYTIRIGSKRYRFALRTISITVDVTLADFRGIE